MIHMHLRRGGRPFNRHALESWLRTPGGQRLLQLEEQEIRRVLPEVFGRHVLQIGSWGQGDELIASSETLHRAVIGTVPDFGAQAMGRPDQLPILAKSVDAVVLPHTLEFSFSPHNVLREANRVLTDRGRLLILGFNPRGSWVWRQYLGLSYKGFPPAGRFYGVGRVNDWLELLDFEVTEVRRFGIGFPWLSPSTDHDSLRPDALLQLFSESYLIVAKRRVVPINLVGRPQRAQVRLIGGSGLAQPAASSVSNAFETQEP
jgi:SAM-dependent methyltransferase